MAAAYRDAPALMKAKAACSEESQSHMENVRKTSEGELLRTAGVAGAKEKVPSAANATCGELGELGGVDRVDPRLFYFRALLDSNRFFSDGERL